MNLEVRKLNLIQLITRISNEEIIFQLEQITERFHQPKKQVTSFKAIRIDTRNFQFNREEAHER